MVIAQTEAEWWPDREIMDFWYRLLQRYLCNVEMSKAEREKLQESIDERRLRLSEISWFIRCICEFIA